MLPLGQHSSKVKKSLYLRNNLMAHPSAHGYAGLEVHLAQPMLRKKYSYGSTADPWLPITAIPKASLARLYPGLGGHMMPSVVCELRRD